MKATTPALLFSLSLLLLLPAAPLAAQDASATDPVPREGAMHERFLLLNERAQAHQGPLDLLFLGDSITQGWEGAGKDVWEKFYGGDRESLNIGVSGDRTQHVLWRLDHGNIDGLAPKVTVIMIGTNNSAPNATGEILEGVQAVVAKVREKLPETKILLLGIFPRSREFDEQRGKVLQVNQALRRLDDGKKIFFLDFGHVFLADDGSIPDEIMPDALHLSPRGYQLWAEAMEPALARLLEDGR